jgi:mannose-6-phosphate isomerase
MSSLLNSKNPFYNFKVIDNSLDFLQEKKQDNDLVASYYVCNGELTFKYQNKNIKILEDQAIIISSANDLSNFQISSDAKIFEISSIKTTKDVIEIIDNDGERSENIISNFKIIKEFKKVNKPWGHEVWFVWLKDYHVFKRIFMKKGNKCSLQYHDEKYETNYLIDGKAKIIKGLHIDLKEEKNKTFETILSKDLHRDYSTVSSAPYVFTNVPGEVHRVYSEEDYTAYEVSTPQLDDVVRVQDDSNRQSGLIVSEHK